MKLICKVATVTALLVMVNGLAVPAHAVADAAVTLDRRGDHDWVLANGLVTVALDPGNATVTGLRYGGHELVSRTGRHRAVYFSRDGGGDYETLPHCTATVAARSPDGVDVRCTHTYAPAAGDKHAWDVDVHYVLRRGVPGVYVYAVCHHPAAYPELTVGEWRMVWSTPADAADELGTICVDAARHWTVPTAADMARGEPVAGAPKEVTRLTTGPWAGRLDCKYEYAAGYWDLDCWGFADDAKHVGAFVVLPAHEFLNDGPFKQDLTAAVGTTLVHLNMNHYDGAGFTIPRGREWTKCYGPLLIYANQGATADECWADARARGRAEAAQWPYPWVRDAAFPLAAGRADVRGRLVVRDALKPTLTSANAWVGLAPAADADFQFSATGYQFWTRAAADGTFALPHVRPGAYTLYAAVDGAVGQFARTGISVTAGHDGSLGDVTWAVPHAGRRIAWEVGTPDRSAAECAHRHGLLPAAAVPAAVDADARAAGLHRRPQRPGEGLGLRPNGSQGRRPRDRAALADPLHAGRRPGRRRDAGAGDRRGRPREGRRVRERRRGRRPGGRRDARPCRAATGWSARRSTRSTACRRWRSRPAGCGAGANTVTLTQESRGDASYVMYDAVRLELP